MAHTVIIGAGPAGLTAAYELSKLGMHSTILEADSQVGGLSRTVDYRGYRFDIGGHRFFSKVPLINELWHEILGEAFLLRPRLSRIHYRGHFFDYPLRPLNALAGLGPIEALLVGLSYTHAKLFPHPQETNFEQWVSNRFGYRLYEIFFKTYTEKVWGIPCTEISADWATQRIKNLSLSEAVRNALFQQNRTKDGQLITTLIDEFYYPRFGPGMMWDRCEQLVARAGSETMRGVRVERIRHRHGRVECVYGRTAGGEPVEFGGDHLISTMAIRELINALDPAPPAAVVLAANELRYRDYLTVVLIVKREQMFPDNWIYVHSPEVRLGRIQNYKNWSPDMVPHPSRTSLGLEYFLWDKDPEWTWSREQLMDLGIRDCVTIGLVNPSEVEDATVVRMTKAYPVYDQSYEANLATVRNYLTGITNLQLIGRNGQHRYNNQDHSMLTGVYAARNLAGANYDIWSVNTEMEYHEETVTASARRADRLVPAPVQPPPSGAPPMSPEEMIEAAFARLDPVALGGAVGLVAGVGLFLATAFLLLKGGPVVGPNLRLLGQFFLGFSVTWSGAVIGALEAGAGGFALGYLIAGLRNLGFTAYAYLVRRRAALEAQRNLLDQV
ncbi:MAG: NAD(P)/FAD-dependent oxidoreductase [Deltaproteobacteria bacterium]|nr:NAD(P)/FAD-dependent oxidoreductase [Deltaproteobacteria bacterium]